MEGYSFQAQITRVSPIGIGSDGLRVDIGFAGTVSGGLWAGCALEGVDYLLIRHDGVGVIDARELVNGPDGVVAALHARGYILPPFAVPKLPVLLDPSFAWPDSDMPLHGSVDVHTGRPEYVDCNSSVFTFTGSINMSQGSMIVNAEAVGIGSALNGVVTSSADPWQDDQMIMKGAGDV